MVLQARYLNQWWRFSDKAVWCYRHLHLPNGIRLFDGHPCSVHLTILESAYGYLLTGGGVMRGVFPEDSTYRGARISELPSTLHTLKLSQSHYQNRTLNRLTTPLQTAKCITTAPSALPPSTLAPRPADLAVLYVLSIQRPLSPNGLLTRLTVLP